MNKDEIKRLGEEWKKLDEKYDTIILELISSSEPVPLAPEKAEELKKIQADLFELETQLFKILTQG